MIFFQASKKRDPSDKLRDGEDSNKDKESNTLCWTKFFLDGLNSPELAKLLVNCLQSIENQVKQLSTFHEQAKESQIKVTESLEFVSAKFDDLERNF